jgi:Ca2+-binding EF-hand superfamily protein
MIMTNFSSKIASAILIISVCSPALASRHGNKAVTHLDTDGDGLVSFEEFMPQNGRADRTSRMMEHADFDEDGAVTLDEMQQAGDERAAQKKEKMEARMAERNEQMLQAFLEMDTDNSGSVTPEEIRLHMFSKIDQDQDGYLSTDEFSQHMQASRGKHDRGSRRQGDRD